MHEQFTEDFVSPPYKIVYTLDTPKITYMKTQFVGLKEFRQNLAHYVEEAQEKKTSFIIMKKNTPVLHVQAIDPEEYEISVIKKELQEAKDEIDKGNYYTHDEVLKTLDLD